MAEKILSCFIDESGDFGLYDYRAPYYLVTMVLHDQNKEIQDIIKVMEEHILNYGWKNHAIHVGPLIRRENNYKNHTVDERKHLFNILYYFTIRASISYMTIKVNKSECSGEIELTAKLSKEISKEIQSHMDFWYSYDKLIIYYDNGQTQLTKILTSVFNTLFSNVEMRKVKPVDYRLFQVADLLCTMEMLDLKAEHHNFSQSENDFFENYRNFKKNYYKKNKIKTIVKRLFLLITGNAIYIKLWCFCEDMFLRLFFGIFGAEKAGM